MDIIFIHGNYPAQFKHLAAGLGRQPQHRVIFLTAREDAKKHVIPGVTVRNYRVHRTVNENTHHYLSATEESIIKGQAVLRELVEIVKEGFKPKLIITHGGVGIGLFVKDILPKAIHISLFEWYFKPETAKWLFNEYNLDEQLKTRTRNFEILQELDSCDIGVTPTEWQKKQFPREYTDKLKVIFDGIDLDFFRPDIQIDEEELLLTGEEQEEGIRITPNCKVLSYATRGMETLRGFPEFMRAASYALQRIPELKVIVAGRDRRAYSYNSPKYNGSWKETLMEELGDFKGKDRIYFTGLMPYIQYKKLLQRSSLHCYFTRPYVTSWSLFEAAACGARLCTNIGEATSGVVSDVKDVKWVDLNNQDEINNTIVGGLVTSSKTKRSKLDDAHELKKCLTNWSNLINQQFGKFEANSDA